MAPIAALQLGLVGRAHLDAGTAERIEAIEQHGAYPHLLFKLRRLPSFGPPFEHLNADPRTRFNTILVPDPELQQASYEACRRGEVPQHPPVGMQIPTVMDPSLAPEGFHIATTYGFFFPCEAPRDDRGRLRDEMAERILDRSLRRVVPPRSRRHVPPGVRRRLRGRRGARYPHPLVGAKRCIGPFLHRGSQLAVPFRAREDAARR